MPYDAAVFHRALTTATLACLLLYPQAARAVTAHAPPCTKQRVSHCVIRAHAVAMTAQYYQNASRVGGTALAGYPLLRAGYGIAQNLEMFYDAPTELAISARGAHYEATRSGLGAQSAVAQDGDVALLMTAESRPPLSPLANLYVLPLFEAHVTAAWSNPAGSGLAAEFGTLNYIATNRDRRRSSIFDMFSATEPVGEGTWISGELGMQSNATWASAGQTRGIASLKRSLGQNTLFNVDLGTALNASGNSKPHYLGAGFTFLR